MERRRFKEAKWRVREGREMSIAVVLWQATQHRSQVARDGDTSDVWCSQSARPRHSTHRPTHTAGTGTTATTLAAITTNTTTLYTNTILATDNSANTAFNGGCGTSVQAAVYRVGSTGSMTHTTRVTVP